MHVIIQYIYICICLYLFKAAEDFSNHISEQFALIFFDLVWCSCGAACTYFELKKKFKTIVMHAETHKHVNVSWCFDYVCGANLNWLYTYIYIYMFCTLIYAPYSICSADRICRLTCRRKKIIEVIRENKLVHILSDGYLVYIYVCDITLRSMGFLNQLINTYNWGPSCTDWGLESYSSLRWKSCKLHLTGQKWQQQ